MTTITEANVTDIPLIHDLAERIWWPTYSSIIPAEQIRYMLDTIYSETSLRESMASGNQKFVILYENEEAKGFAGYGRRDQEPEVAKLHKIYILPNNQGKGFGRTLINHVKEDLLQQGIHTLDLNVNRFNPAKTFYERLGFVVIREEDIAIGAFWMNDFVMRITF